MNWTPIEISKALQPLADKLGQGAEQLFRIYVRQAIINGITEIVIGSLFITIWAVSSRYAMKRANKIMEKKSYSEAYAVTMIFVAITGLLIVGLGIWAIADGISELLNPQYTAIHNIITDIHGSPN